MGDDKELSTCVPAQPPALQDYLEAQAESQGCTLSAPWQKASPLLLPQGLYR